MPRTSKLQRFAGQNNIPAERSSERRAKDSGSAPHLSPLSFDGSIEPRTREARAQFLPRSQQSLHTIPSPRTSHPTALTARSIKAERKEHLPCDGESDNDAYVDEEYSDDDDPTVFKSRRELSPGFVRKMTVADLMRHLDSPWMKLDPDYQRDVVWGPMNMSGLINSLIENYYIPPIIFNLEAVLHTDGREYNRRICVDGKQRLSSIRAFMRGDIPCRDRRGKRWFYQHPPAGYVKSRRILPEDAKQDFRNKWLVVHEYAGLSAAQEEDLFARVQKGIPLTPAEKLRATRGPWQALAKKMEGKYSDVLSLIDTTRGAGFKVLLGLYGQTLETHNPSRPDGMPKCMLQLPAMQGLCTGRQESCNKENEERFDRIFILFRSLISTYRGLSLTTKYKNFAPLEFVTICVLLSKYMDSRSDELLAMDISYMGKVLRENLPNLMMSNLTWKVAWDLLLNLEFDRGAGDITPAARAASFARLRQERDRAARIEEPLAISTEVNRVSEDTIATSRPTSACEHATGSVRGTRTSLSVHRVESTHRERSASVESVDSVLGRDSPPPLQQKPAALHEDTRQPLSSSFTRPMKMESEAPKRLQDPPLKHQLSFSRSDSAAALRELAAKRPRVSSLKD